MHDPCMATKTISLELDAYEKLRAAKTSPKESFSSVVRRATWPKKPGTGKAILAHFVALVKEDSLLSSERLEQLDAAQEADRPPEDPWRSS